MKHLAAYCLLVLDGNESPSAADVEKLCKESGVFVDKENRRKSIWEICSEAVMTTEEVMQNTAFSHISRLELKTEVDCAFGDLDEGQS